MGYECDAYDNISKVINALGYKTIYVYDAAGNVTLITYLDGSTVTNTWDAMNRLSEKPYGVANQEQNGYTYNSEYYDASTGMIYLRARWYEPVSMPFFQPDIVRGDLTEPQSLNRYAHVKNSPVKIAVALPAAIPFAKIVVAGVAAALSG